MARSQSHVEVRGGCAAVEGRTDGEVQMHAGGCRAQSPHRFCLDWQYEDVIEAVDREGQGCKRWRKDKSSQERRDFLVSWEVEWERLPAPSRVVVSRTHVERRKRRVRLSKRAWYEKIERQDESQNSEF